MKSKRSTTHVQNPNEPNAHNFQVHLDGIINLLSNHLYSSPKVFIRELLQNAVDAITARRSLEPNLQGEIHIQILDGPQPSIVFEDNGIGLTESELFQFLATIGASTKRENGAGKDEFIGQFGIGILSCFMITEEVTMITRSAKGGPALEWCGRYDGTFTTRILPGEFETGTKVFFKAKAGSEKMLEIQFVEHLVRHYGNLLPIPIYISDEAGTPGIINTGTWPADNPNATSEELLEYGQNCFEDKFMAVIPLRSSDGKTIGLAYVPRKSQNPGNGPRHHIYLKRMLLSNENRDILPEWAFFVRAIVNTTQLRPTASREAIYQDAQLEKVRKQLGRCIRSYLLKLKEEDPELLSEIIAQHRISIKMLAVEDDEFFRIIIPYLTFPSNFGELSLQAYRKYGQVIYHLPDAHAFEQVRHVATLHQIAIINSRYDFDEQLLEKLPSIFDGMKVTAVDLQFIMGQLSLPSEEEQRALEPLLKMANEELHAFRCKAILRKFEPAGLPVLLQFDSAMHLERRAHFQNKDIAPKWQKLLVDFTKENSSSTLCLNAANPLLSRMATLENRDARRSFLHLLYVQAVLLSNNQVTREELNLMTNSLGHILQLQVDAQFTNTTKEDI